MKNLLFLGIMFALCYCKQNPKMSGGEQAHEDRGMTYIEDWFEAWELVSDSLQIKSKSIPIMLFFDKDFSYTNSNEDIENSIQVDGPDFMGRSVSWKKSRHNDSIRLPGGQKIPIGILSFAVPINQGERQSYFVMALPSVWENAKVGSEELGDENFYTSVFLHEFAHSQQTRNFGKKLDQFDRTHDFESKLNDDMIQGEFRSDSLYAKLLDREIKVLYDAYFANDKNDLRKLALVGIDLYDKRQGRFFSGKRKVYSELDDFFLTMEGIGQYVALVWLTSPRGGNLSKGKAIEGLRRDRKNWAQDESLALFLIYTRLTDPDWNNEMFGDKLFEIKNLVRERLQN